MSPKSHRSTPPPHDLAGQLRIPFDQEIPGDQPWSSEDAARWLLTLDGPDQLATVGRWAAQLDDMDEQIRRLLADLGSYRRLAQEPIVAERDALAERIKFCCEVLADLPAPGPESDRGPVPPAA
jgi:hypothetical protein